MSFKLKVGYFLSALLLVSALASCGKERKEDSEFSERRLLEAHLTVHYNDTLTKLPSGSYLMVRKKGSGAKMGKDGSAYVYYSKTDLRGIYEQSNIEEIAKNIGGYSPSSYYGPTLYQVGNYTMVKGMEEAFEEMSVGSDFRVIIPSWASKLNYEGAEKQQSSTSVYDFEIVEVIRDFDRYEIDTLASFAAIHYPGLDSLKNGFYFKHLKVGEKDSVTTSGRISYNYVGRLLNGFVFDTNIEDTARKYRIYDSSKDYSPVYWDVPQEGSSASQQENSVIKGFEEALLRMRQGGEAITFFSSEWGYGNETQKFGKRQQLHFYIEVRTKAE